MKTNLSSACFLTLAGLVMPSIAQCDTFVVKDGDFADGVYEFRYYSKSQTTTVNGVQNSAYSLFLTNDGWDPPPSASKSFWHAKGGFYDAQVAGSCTMGWDLRGVTRTIARVEMMADAHLAQFDPFRDDAWCDRLYGRIALPDATFGANTYMSVFEFVGDNDPGRNTVENAGFVDDITDVIGRIAPGWMADPTLLELKFGYQQHPIDASHPSIPREHLQIFRDNTGAGDDSFLLRITLEANPSALVNISTRGTVGIGPERLIAGFVIEGDTPKTVIIRGVGPALTGYGLTDVLPDPRIDLYRKDPGGDVLYESNGDWDPLGDLEATFAKVGAFAFQPNSKDACLMLTLPPGGYTAKVGGEGGVTGVALVEVYEVP